MTIICLIQGIYIAKLLYDRYCASIADDAKSLTLISNNDGTFTIEGDAIYTLENGKLHVKLDSSKTPTPSSTQMIALNLFIKSANLGNVALDASSLPDNVKRIAGDILYDIPRLINSVMPTPLPENNLNSLLTLPSATPVQALTEKE